jgi:uncharacterized protein YggE
MKKIFMGMLALALTFSATAQLNELSEYFTKQRSINVNGTAEMEVVPDEIYVQVDLREYDKKGAGKVDIESIKNKFIKACISLGIPDTNISIQGYQGWDGNYWWSKKNKKKNPDMMASISYWVKLSNTKKMDELVDKLDDEATQNFFIAKVSHSKVQEFKKQLKVQAIKAAKDKAIYLAAALGENIGAAITINEPNEINVYPMPMYSNRMVKMEAVSAADAGAPAPNIDFKKIKYQFEVNVVFALSK